MFVLLREGVTSPPQPKTDRRRRRERQDSSTHLSRFFCFRSAPPDQARQRPDAFGWARAASPARATLAVRARVGAMNRQRNPRSGTRASGVRPVRSERVAVPAGLGEASQATTSPEGAVLSFLSDVLVGDATWTMAEVQRLVVVRDLADLGRWRVAGLDDEATTSR